MAYPSVRYHNTSNDTHAIGLMSDKQLEAISCLQEELCDLPSASFQSFLQVKGHLSTAECDIINESKNITNAQKFLCILEIIKRKCNSWNLLIEYLRGQKCSVLANKLQAACGELSMVTLLPNGKQYHRRHQDWFNNTRRWIAAALTMAGALVVIVIIAVSIMKRATTDINTASTTASTHDVEKIISTKLQTSTANSSIGYNVVELPNREILYLDSDALYKRSIDDSKTYRFEPQPRHINEHLVLFSRFGTPSLLMISPLDSTKLLGISHLINGKWEINPLDEVIIVSQGPIFTQDQSHLYVFSDNADKSQPFFIAVLKLLRGKYIVQRKIDIDFIKTDANFDRLPQPRSLVAGAVVIGPQLFVFYTVLKSIDEANVDSLAIIDIQSGSVVSRHKTAGSAPNFRVSDIFHIHNYKGRVVYASLDFIYAFNMGTYEWNKGFQFNTNPYVGGTAFSQGSTITAQGDVLVCLKYASNVMQDIQLHVARLLEWSGLR